MYATSTVLVITVIVSLRVASGTLTPNHWKKPLNAQETQAQRKNLRGGFYGRLRDSTNSKIQSVNGGANSWYYRKPAYSYFNANVPQTQHKSFDGHFRTGFRETFKAKSNKLSVNSGIYVSQYGKQAVTPFYASKSQRNDAVGNLRENLRETPASKGNLPLTKRLSAASNKSVGFARKEQLLSGSSSTAKHGTLRENGKSNEELRSVNGRKRVSKSEDTKKITNNKTSSNVDFLRTQAVTPKNAINISNVENNSVLQQRKFSNSHFINSTGHLGQDQGNAAMSVGKFDKGKHENTKTDGMRLRINKANSQIDKPSKVSQGKSKQSQSYSSSNYHHLKQKITVVSEEKLDNHKSMKHGHRHHHSHHHHQHHHHHRRHHHHHHPHRQNAVNRIHHHKQVQVSKGGDQYKVSPPTMIRKKPKPPKQQPEIFRTPKKVDFKKNYNHTTSQKRFVIIGGPHGAHNLKRFHFSPALVSALKLVLNKKNSFKKDADILNLAQALQTKDTDNDNIKNNSITTAVSSGLTQNGQRARLVTVKDLGYINTKVRQHGSMKAKVHPKMSPQKSPGHKKALGHLGKDHPEHEKDPFINSILERIKNFQEGNNRKGPHGSIVGIVPPNNPTEELGEPAYRSSISDDRSHSALVNPTSLGISILKLLFGKRAKLIVKPKYKMLVNDRPGAKFLQGYGTQKQRAELQKEIEDENKLILLKGTRKEKFEATLAKSISNLITAMNKNDMATVEATEARKKQGSAQSDSPKQGSAQSDSPKQGSAQSDSSKQGSAQSDSPKQGAAQSDLPKQGSAQNETSVQQKPNGEEQGTRKSWVLLKMPKSGEKEQVEHVQKYQDNEDAAKQAIKLIATVGKHNNRVADVQVSKPKHDDDYIPDPPKRVKDIASDTPSRAVPQITYNLNGIKSKNDLGRLSSSSSSNDPSAMESTLGKILKGIQDSIKELKSERREDEDDPPRIHHRKWTPMISTETSPVSFSSRSTSGSSSSESGDVAKIPDLLAAVNKLLGATSRKNHGMPGVPSDQTGTEASTISVPPVDSQSDAARRYVSDVKASTDPLLPKPTYDEPITVTSHSRVSHGQSPSDNVLFESDQMATQRDTANSIEAMKLKEDLEAFAEKGLNTHNKYRSLHHSPDLIWSDELATQAEKLAYGMAMKGTIEKSALATTLNYGENVAKISGTTFDRAGEEATNLWYAEISNYSFSDPRISPETDSFTQVIWKSSQKLGMGCARDLQTNDLYVVALYDPKGNDEAGLRNNVINKGGVTEDVYASIFKRQKIKG